MRTTVFDERFDNLDAWAYRDLEFVAGRQYARGDERAVVIGEGLELGIMPTDVVDGQQRYGYGHIGTQEVTVVPGDRVHALIQFAPGRGLHGSLWLQAVQTYGTPADYEADIEHYGANNPWRRTGVDLYQAVHWRAQDQPFGQYTSVKLETNSTPVLGERVPWSDGHHHYQTRVHRDGFSFLVDGQLLNRVRTENTPRRMFICLSMISRDFEYEDLVEAFEADPLVGPGVMMVKRLWVTRT